jgi:large subunit ribosomal protein L32
MAVPKKKKSKSARDMRRSHHALDKNIVVEDKTTGELKRPHHVSPDGYYNGRQVTTAKVHR